MSKQHNKADANTDKLYFYIFISPVDLFDTEKNITCSLAEVCHEWKANLFTRDFNETKDSYENNLQTLIVNFIYKKLSKFTICLIFKQSSMSFFWSFSFIIVTFIPSLFFTFITSSHLYIVWSISNRAFLSLWF